MSCSRHCAFYKAVDSNWYMELAHEEHAGREDSDTYGPFASFDAAKQYLDRNFSNPGGWWDDDSGTAPVPTQGHNGEPVIDPRKSQRMSYGRPRW